MTALKPRMDTSLLQMAQPRWAGERPEQSSKQEPRTLTSAVLATVRQWPEEALHRVAWPDAGVAFQPHSLLAILTYCYAKEVCATEAIYGLLCGDANFRRLCGDEFPGESYLRRFRRYNRSAIAHCLSAVLGFLGRKGSANTPAVPAARESSGRAASASVQSQDPILTEAQRRIDIAIILDMVE